MGSTPTDKTPTAIATAIQKIYDDRYNAGRTQGQNDVKNNPGAYGIVVAKKLNSITSNVQSIWGGGSTRGQYVISVSYDVNGNPLCSGSYRQTDDGTTEIRVASWN